MAYRNSQIDRQNFSWFASDRKVNSLVEIELDRGRIAQLGPLCAHFTYPVAAFCGERGAGGSALLAVAACAYHGRSCPPGRQKPYYTFGDFFTFSADDAHIKGCVLRYTLRLPLIDVVETRRREPCQRWNDYARRSERAVYYLDRDRLPGAEAVLAAVAAVGRGGMVCVEQLEWGLSVPQQKKLVTALKALCAKNHCQLLCTTRSPAILAALPPAARYRLVQQDGQTLLEHPVPPEAALPQHREKLPIYLQKEAGPWFWGAGTAGVAAATSAGLLPYSRRAGTATRRRRPRPTGGVYRPRRGAHRGTVAGGSTAQAAIAAAAAGCAQRAAQPPVSAAEPQPAM